MVVPTPIKSIRLKCLDCTNQQHLEVRHCKSYDCPIWYYRMGRRPRQVDLEKNTGAI